MTFLFIALIPPILYSVSALLDKVVAHGERDDARVSVLMAIGGFFNFLIAIPFLIFLLYRGGFEFSILLFLNGLLFSLAIYIYLFLLKTNDVDRVVPWFQTIPVFGIVGGILFLAEFPTLFEVLGIILIVLAGFIISIKKGRVDKGLVVLMILSSLLIAINDVVFAYFGRDMSVSNALFSDIAGKGIIGLAFLFVPSSLNGFKLALKTKFGLQSLNEILYAVGDAIFDVAKLFFPVALVQALLSTQPVFTFVGSFILKKVNSKYIDEEETNYRLRIIGIILFVLGGLAISLVI